MLPVGRTARLVEQGGVVVAITAASCDGTVVVEVDDDGPGVPPRHDSPSPTPADSSAG